MGRDSKIEWTDHTFNPWIGCAKVSDGCKHCYAETLMDTRYGCVQWGVNGTRVRTSAANWKQPLKWNREAEAAGVRRRVFCASLADVFENRPELQLWRTDLFAMIQHTPYLDWLLLTKRPENVPGCKLPENVWIGTSVENQDAADERIPQLLRIPAVVRFLSMEPLLGPVSFHDIGSRLLGGIDWVIVGGESGHGARPMHPNWVRSIRDQCQAAGVPFFFKQWGEWVVSTYIPDSVSHSEYERAWMAWPWAIRTGNDISGDTTMMVRVGKRAAGRLLDGREWNDAP